MGINCFFRIQNFALCANRYETAHHARKTTCADEEKQYFDQNIWDMPIGIAYFVLDILQVGISRSTYILYLVRTDVPYLNCPLNKGATRALDKKCLLMTFPPGRSNQK